MANIVFHYAKPLSQTKHTVPSSENTYQVGGSAASSSWQGKASVDANPPLLAKDAPPEFPRPTREAPKISQIVPPAAPTDPSEAASFCGSRSKAASPVGGQVAATEEKPATPRSGPGSEQFQIHSDKLEKVKQEAQSRHAVKLENVPASGAAGQDAAGVAAISQIEPPASAETNEGALQPDGSGMEGVGGDRSQEWRVTTNPFKAFVVFFQIKHKPFLI